MLFTIWIALNVHPLSGSSFGGFDPFPFGLLTMAVSLEAIILSVFVLLSQNRQAERDRGGAQHGFLDGGPDSISMAIVEADESPEAVVDLDR